MASKTLVSIRSFLAKLIRFYAPKARRLLARAALEAVAEVAATMGQADGDTKRSAAFQGILDRLKADGIEMARREINKALEDAVNYFAPAAEK